MKKIKEADKGYISLDVRINDSEYWLSSISYISATKFVNNKIIDNLNFYIKDSLQNRSELKKSNYIRTFKFAYIELLKFIVKVSVFDKSDTESIVEHFISSKFISYSLSLSTD